MGMRVPSITTNACPRHLRDAVVGMIRELRKLFDSDRFAFDAAFRWVAYQAGMEGPGGVVSVPGFRRVRPWSHDSTAGV
jgi:hypothetical protein